MKKYHFRINNSIQHHNAGSKAVADCKKILMLSGYNDLEIYLNKSKIQLPFTVIKLIFLLVKYLFVIESKSLIFTQYPILGFNSFFKYYSKLLKLKGCKFSCIIHDLDDLRDFPGSKKSKDIDALHAYDAIITHNAKMSQWIIEKGYKGFISEINLFDYLVDSESELKSKAVLNNEPDTVSIAFAGNLGTLGRSNFLKDLIKSPHNYLLNLYGSGFNTKNNNQVKWHGSFPTDQIAKEIKGDYGLIWDGDSMQQLSGIMGNYLQFNTPHKTSLYLIAGLPVIVSERAAIASFIIKNKLGICVDDLNHLSEKIEKISSDYYNEMKENVRDIGGKLLKGDFFKAAITVVENHLFHIGFTGS